MILRKKSGTVHKLFKYCIIDKCTYQLYNLYNVVVIIATYNFDYHIKLSKK